MEIGSEDLADVGIAVLILLLGPVSRASLLTYHVDCGADVFSLFATIHYTLSR